VPQVKRFPLLTLVFVLATFGLYAPFWSAITWAQMSRFSDESRWSPAAHALGLCVPILSWFRVLDHVRLENEVLDRNGAATRVSAALVLALAVAASLVVSPINIPVVLTLADAGMSTGRAALMVNYVAVALIAATVAYLQMRLNDAWRISGDSSSLTFGRLETVLMVVALLFWMIRIGFWLAR
jgi:hypothetical protein